MAYATKLLRRAAARLGLDTAGEFLGYNSTTGVGASVPAGGSAPRLDQILDPTADKTFDLGTHSLKFAQANRGATPGLPAVVVKEPPDGLEDNSVFEVQNGTGDYSAYFGRVSSQTPATTGTLIWEMAGGSLNLQNSTGANPLNVAASGDNAWGAYISSSGTSGVGVAAQSAQSNSGLFQSLAIGNAAATLVAQRQSAGATANLFEAQDQIGTALASIDKSGNLSALNFKPTLSGTSASIGGGALLAGAAASGTVSITGARNTMAVAVTPTTYPGDGIVWSAYVSANDVVTVKVTAILALTPTASTYNVRVVQ